ncbi:LegC family aminotransferase [Candidatus Pelagibacter sp.]|jgi:aminotransferase in exopolysaccharide biosynthesis|nr:LegC family aminotransferase [Candidatus Pelagibacter sp.]
MKQTEELTKKSIDQKIVEVLRSVLGRKKHSLHTPVFDGKENQYLKKCIDSTYVSSVGSFVNKFEQDLADYTGARRAITVINGTAALQIALKLSGVVEGDEVLVPTLTFVATANAVHYLGAKAHFVDCEEKNLGLDAKALRSWLKHCTELTSSGCRNRLTGKRIKALLPMHTFGHSCDLEGLLAVAHDYKLVLVEDAAESLGSYYQGKHTGTFGKFGTLSFNGNKIITTGGGGAILTNDEKLADRAKHLTTTAKLPHKWEYVHDEIGYNFRMPNLNAALGCAQLEQLNNFIKSKRGLYSRYQEAFKSIPQIRLLREPDRCDSNYWMQTIILEDGILNQRDIILEATNNANFMTRPAWTLLHQLEPYKDCPRAPLPVSESLVKKIINIPSSAGLEK